MPDIDPAALSRPSIQLSTPILATKSITVSAPKVIKTSQIIPARIDLEPLYAALKGAIGNEQWPTYKETISKFVVGTSGPLSPLATLNITSEVAAADILCRAVKPGRILGTHRSYHNLP